MHSNDDIKYHGGHNTVTKTSSACGAITINGGQNSIASPTPNAPSRPMPVYTLAEFAARADYTHSGSIHISGSDTLEPGLHYVNGNAKISSSSLTANVTIVATGSIEISGSGKNLTASDPTGMLLFAGTDVKLTGGSNTFAGLVYAPNGTVEASGDGNTFPNGRIWALEVKITGGHGTFGAAGQ